MLAVILLFLNSCYKDDEIDKQKPVIDNSSVFAFPQNCDTLYFGETFRLKVLLQDNAELGSKGALNIDIHNNFDHHSHSTDVSNCSMNPLTTPVNPYTFISDFDIPEGMHEYETDIAITVPDGNDSGPFDDGDYHFFISLTDKEGWSMQKGISIKIIHR
jgi:hypothetical protein